MVEENVGEGLVEFSNGAAVVFVEVRVGIKVDGVPVVRLVGGRVNAVGNTVGSLVVVAGTVVGALVVGMMVGTAVGTGMGNTIGASDGAPVACIPVGT